MTQRLGWLWGLALVAFGCGGGTSGNGPKPDAGDNVFIDQIKQNTVDKIDLLFMIDNSISMADKQVFLSDAVPQLVSRLVTPSLDPVTGKQEFRPVKDIHIGVITSSLGGHGGDICSTFSANETSNDRAHLLPSVRPNLSSFQDQGFLWWDPDAKYGGETDAASLISSFQAHVQAAGEQGCGYEASLEAWYRFLVDPEPPLDVTTDGSVILLQGVDDTLLQQRKDFLRADSLLSIIMLTDENDCSTAEVGQNWISTQASGGGSPFHLPRAAAACDSDPNGPCCRSCETAEPSGPPAGCTPLDSDPVCGQDPYHDDLSDHLNVRCWDQKRRFGIDFLYPTRRYVDGLRNQTVPDRAGNLVPNPLYTSLGGTSRDPSLVFFAVIVGVPWQDIATDESLSGPGLAYLSAGELAAKNRWSWLVPSCKIVGAGGVCDDGISRMRPTTH